MPTINLDGSYGFGSNYFSDAGFRYGSDLIFTYGPLGYLFYPEDIGNHIVIANVIRGAVWALLLVHLVLLYRAGMKGLAKALLFMAAIIPIRIPLFYHFDYYAVTVLIVLIVYSIERPRAVLAPISIVFLTGILALTKFTGYAMALIGVLLLLVVVQRERTRQRVGVGDLDSALREGRTKRRADERESGERQARQE